MTSPSASLSSAIIRASSPTKPGQPIGYQPNPHPYAIKTTSTGILSRSTTTPTSASQTYNHYIPPSPSPSPTKISFSHSDRSSRHRYSRSLTDENGPRPLPAPPEDLAYYSTRPSSGSSKDLSVHECINLQQLPSDYFAENFPDMASFIEEHGLTGRSLLQLDERDLDAYGITHPPERSRFLNALESFRQNVLEKEGKALGTFRPPYMNSTFPLSQPQPSQLSGPQLQHCEDFKCNQLCFSPLAEEEQKSPKEGLIARPNSRVRGIVASLERSFSVDTRFSTSSGSSHKGGNNENDRRRNSNELYVQHECQQNYLVQGSRPLPLPPPTPFVPKPAKIGVSIPASSFPFFSTLPFPDEAKAVSPHSERISPKIEQHLSLNVPPSQPPSCASFSHVPDKREVCGHEREFFDTLRLSSEEVNSSNGMVTIRNEACEDKHKSSSDLSNSPPRADPQDAVHWENLQGKTLSLVSQAASLSLTIAQPIPVRAKSKREEELTIEELLALQEGLDDVKADRGVGGWLYGKSDSRVTARRVTSPFDNKRLSTGTKNEIGGGVMKECRTPYRKELETMFSRTEDWNDSRGNQSGVGVDFEVEAPEQHEQVGQCDGEDYIQEKAISWVQDPTMPEDPIILALEVRMEDTRRTVEELRKRVMQVEANIQRIEGTYEMQVLPMSSKAYSGAVGNLLVEKGSQADPHLSARQKEHHVISPVAQDSVYHTWTRNVFQVLFGFPGFSFLKALSKGMFSYAANLVSYFTRYVVGVPRYVLSVGISVPRYTLLLGFGFCAALLRSLFGGHAVTNALAASATTATAGAGKLWH